MQMDSCIIRKVDSGEESAHRLCGSAAHGLIVRGCATQRVARNEPRKRRAKQTAVRRLRSRDGRPSPVALAPWALTLQLERGALPRYSDHYYSCLLSWSIAAMALRPKLPKRATWLRCSQQKCRATGRKRASRL